MLASHAQPVRAFFRFTPITLRSRVNFRLTVARTPSKLIDALLAKGVPQSVITAQLSITEGDVKDVEAVRKTLSPTGKVADVIISGIGRFFLSAIAKVHLFSLAKPRIPSISSLEVN